MRRFLTLIVVSFVVMVASSWAQSTSREILFVNGAIYVNSDRKVNNLLIKDGVVAGFDVNVAQYPHAKIVDLKGAAAYPGFNDSHVHLVGMAVSVSTGVELNGASKSDDIAKIVGDHCKKMPKGIPVVAHGFVFDNYDAWNLTDLEKLDAVTGDRPVMIADQLGHSYIVNSAAMRISGITGSTPAPPGGKIVKQSGKPTGMLRETAGSIAGNKSIFPEIKDSVIRESTRKLFEQWASMGYTAVIELEGGPMGRIWKPGLLRELERGGQLPLRINYAYTFFNLDEIEGYKNSGEDTDLVHFAGLKLFVDGAAGNGGSWTSWPNLAGNHGLYAVYTDDSFGEKYNIYRIVEKTEELGVDVHYHVGGDMSIEAVLSAVEAAYKKNGRLKGKHTFYHLGFVTDDQIGRMKKLRGNVIAGVQPSLHWEYSKNITPMYYSEHAKGSYPYKKLRDAGITLAYGTDFASSPVELCWPTVIMKAALTGGGNPVGNPPLTMRDMIEGFTVGGYATTREAKVGKLEIGYKADIVVYENDLFSIPPMELSKDNPRVIATWVGGRQVYSVKAKK
jgi:predicted amidohydrolase YtcJ